MTINQPSTGPVAAGKNAMNMKTMKLTKMKSFRQRLKEQMKADKHYIENIAKNRHMEPVSSIEWEVATAKLKRLVRTGDVAHDCKFPKGKLR